VLVGLAAAAVLVGAAGFGGVAGAAPGAKRAASTQWDVVLILTDDQPVGTLQGMPQTSRLLAARGITYPNAIVPTSLCCPSRTSLLTGKLATATGIYSNESDTGFGGYPAVKAAGLENDTLATSLDAAGYDTAYFGKYLNEYGALYDGVAPPGWDTWRVFTTTAQSGRYRNFGLSDAVPFGQRPRTATQEFIRTYSTKALGRLAVDHIRTAPRTRPLFTVFAPYAPHSPFTAERKYRGVSRPPADYPTAAVNELDVSDKPSYVQQVPLSDTVEGAPPGVNLAKQIDTLRSVDDQVADIFAAVKASGRLDRTLFVYTSDNGYMHGEHRLDGKGYPYLKSTNVPLVMRFGRGAPSVVDPRLTVANVDVAATILQTAGLPNRTQGTPVTAERNTEGVLMVSAESTSRAVRPPFCAWRTRDELFVRYGTAEEEFYDYRADPHELQNRVADPVFRNRVEQLRAATRAACTPTPPGFGPAFDSPRWRSTRGAPGAPSPDAGSDTVARAD
jgi:arylsulfatase A-like enzyme